MNRLEVFQKLQSRIESLQEGRTHPVRVAINGIQGAGKTSFAKSFVAFLNEAGQEAIHLTIDGFHNKKEQRYRQGRDSAKGYYEDSYDEEAFVEKVLKMSQQDEPAYVPVIHDLETDENLDLAPIQLSKKSIIIVDGAFLFKPVYEPHWDLKVYLHVEFEVALERGIQRDKESLGGEASTRKKYLNRYHAASLIYMEEVKPQKLADFMIDNTDFKKLDFEDLTSHRSYEN